MMFCKVSFSIVVASVTLGKRLSSTIEASYVDSCGVTDDIGQCCSDADSQDGPLHQRLWLIRVDGRIPRDAQSAGFDSDAM